MSTTNSAGKQASLGDYPTVSDGGELVLGHVDVVDRDGTDARVDRALTEFLSVESGSFDTTFRVHSGSGETYAVDLNGPDGYFCQCEDRADVCKHIMRVLIEHPHLLPGGDDGEDDEESEEIVTDGGRTIGEWAYRDGVPCPERMSAAIELTLRWEIEHAEAKAFLRESGFYARSGR